MIIIKRLRRIYRIQTHVTPLNFHESGTTNPTKCSGWGGPIGFDLQTMTTYIWSFFMIHCLLKKERKQESKEA